MISPIFRLLFFFSLCFSKTNLKIFMYFSFGFILRSEMKELATSSVFFRLFFLFCFNVQKFVVRNDEIDIVGSVYLFGLVVVFQLHYHFPKFVNQRLLIPKVLLIEIYSGFFKPLLQITHFVAIRFLVHINCAQAFFFSVIFFLQKVVERLIPLGKRITLVFLFFENNRAQFFHFV